MRPNKLEQLSLRLQARLLDGPHAYITELITQAGENADDEIERALARGRMLHYKRALALVDELEAAATTLDLYVGEGKIDSGAAFRMNTDIQNIRKRLETYIPRNDGPSNDKGGDALVPA